ncbi:MAG: hypothetical protein KGJ68_00650 [Gammaproteobacteria bacterium]|nr:hypothetical protein [Gammaproteobacteria bacterium]
MTGITHDDEIRDYLVGRLSERERLVFQDRVARDPTLARELEHSLRLREGLRQLQGQGYFAAPDAPRLVRSVRLARWLPLAAAAIVAAVCVGAWWELKDADSLLSASPDRIAAGHGSPAAQWTFISTRGAQVPRLELPTGGRIELRIAPETSATGAQRITLLRIRGTTVQTLGAVEGTVMPDHYLHAYADAARLSPGDYRLRIEAEEGQATSPREFPFTLMPAAASGPHQ